MARWEKRVWVSLNTADDWCAIVWLDEIESGFQLIFFYLSFLIIFRCRWLNIFWAGRFDGMAAGIGLFVDAFQCQSLRFRWWRSCLLLISSTNQFRRIETHFMSDYEATCESSCASQRNEVATAWNASPSSPLINSQEKRESNNEWMNDLFGICTSSLGGRRGQLYQQFGAPPPGASIIVDCVCPIQLPPLSETEEDDGEVLISWLDRSISVVIESSVEFRCEMRLCAGDPAHPTRVIYYL